MKEIKELDNKYLVLKWKDIERLHPNLRKAVDAAIIAINVDRSASESKPPMNKNQYLVLNLDDEIDVTYIQKRVFDGTMGRHKYKVKDIAVDLVNAILRAKESEKTVDGLKELAKDKSLFKTDYSHR